MTTTVRLEDAEQAEFVRAICPAAITRDGDTLTLTEAALTRLAEQSPDHDGHYDGTAVWMQGMDYPVERSEDDQPRTAPTSSGSRPGSAPGSPGSAAGTRLS